MTEQLERKPWGWKLKCILGLLIFFVVYPLSIGPVFALMPLGGGPNWIMFPLGLFYFPLFWMCHLWKPAEELLHTYIMYWSLLRAMRL